MKIIVIEIIGKDSDRALAELISNAQSDKLEVKINKLAVSVPMFEKRETVYSNN